MRRCSKCHLFISYFICVAGILSFAANLIILFTLDSWTNIPFSDGEGNLRFFNIIAKKLYVIQVIKVILCLMTAKIGCLGVKTFRPILREINHPAIYQNTTGTKHSDRIKDLKKKVGKRQVAILVLSLITIFVFRCFALKKARQFIDQEYNSIEQPGKYTFGHKALYNHEFGHSGKRHLNMTDFSEIEKHLFKSVNGDIVNPKKPLIPDGPIHGNQEVIEATATEVSEPAVMISSINFNHLYGHKDE